MAIGDSKNKQNNQQNNADTRGGFSGERLTTYTKGILLAQAGLSCALALWFIASSVVEHPFLVMLTAAIHPGVAAMGAVALFGWTLTLVKHIDVLVKEHKE